MDFDTWFRRAWDTHADDSAGTAARLVPEGLALVSSDAQLQRLAHLGHHVLGEHLARWDDGRGLLAQLRGHPAWVAGGAADSAAQIYDASLAVCAGQADAAATLAPSERVRATVAAATNLAAHDTARALALFQQGLADAQQADLPATDPVSRSLAMAGNNLAGTLEEKADRSAHDVELMVLAARTGRHYWALAGGWLETERAEYRLAMTWLKAGDAAEALLHAQACADIVAANDGAALERFFAQEAIALAQHALGDAAAVQAAGAAAQEAFAALEEGDRGWCQATLDKMQALR